MEDYDTQDLNGLDDEDMLLANVIQDEHELLFLDIYLRESFRGRGMNPVVSAGGGIFDEEDTI
jgi:hypothetical protein